MLVKHWTLRITGQPMDYQIHLECDGTVESIPDLHESLRCLLGNLRLTAEEVNADLSAEGYYEAHSLPLAPAGDHSA
jgi:hypothetical protein